MDDTGHIASYTTYKFLASNIRMQRIKKTTSLYPTTVEPHYPTPFIHAYPRLYEMMF